MRFEEAVEKVATVTDLRRVAKAHVVEHKQLSNEQLPAAVVKTKAQYVDCGVVKQALDFSESRVQASAQSKHRPHHRRRTESSGRRMVSRRQPQPRATIPLGAFRRIRKVRPEAAGEVVLREPQAGRGRADERRTERIRRAPSSSLRRDCPRSSHRLLSSAEPSTSGKRRRSIEAPVLPNKESRERSDVL